MSDGRRWMPVAPEVAALQRKIGRHDHLLASADLQDRAVVANRQSDLRTAAARAPSYVLNQSEFAACTGGLANFFSRFFA